MSDRNSTDTAEQMEVNLNSAEHEALFNNDDEIIRHFHVRLNNATREQNLLETKVMISDKACARMRQELYNEKIITSNEKQSRISFQRHLTLEQNAHNLSKESYLILLEKYDQVITELAAAYTFKESYLVLVDKYDEVITELATACAFKERYLTLLKKYEEVITELATACAFNDALRRETEYSGSPMGIQISESAAAKQEIEGSPTRYGAAIADFTTHEPAGAAVKTEGLSPVMSPARMVKGKIVV